MQKKWLALLVVVSLLAAPAFGQNTYQPFPAGVMLQFSYNSGAPVALGFICATASGTTNNLDTYQTPAGTANTNPIHLDAGGRASIYLQSSAYTLKLYAPGTGNTCNSTAVGALIKSVDNVLNPSDLYTTSFATKKLDNVRVCDQFSGANAGVKIAACIADLPSTGGTADARGFEGAQTVATNVFSGVTKPVRLLLGGATFAVSAGQVVNCTGCSIGGLGRGSTVLHWTAGAGAAVSLGTAADTRISDLSVTGTDASGEIGVAVVAASLTGTMIERIAASTLRTAIQVGTSGGSGPAAGTIRDVRIQTAGTSGETGVAFLTAANGWILDGAIIRDSNGGASETTIGVLVSGAAGVRIVNSDIEFNPGGNVVINNTGGTSSGTVVAGNYFRNVGNAALDIDIASTGVDGTLISNNRMTASASPNPDYSIHITSGSTETSIGPNRWSGYDTAFIHNGGASSAGTFLVGNMSQSGTEIDVLTGVYSRISASGAASLIAKGLTVEAGTDDGTHGLTVISSSTTAHIHDLFGNGDASLCNGGTCTILGLAAFTGGGITVGAPTGGAKGSGTINIAGDIYKNNTAFSNPDYVFDRYYTGKTTAAYPGMLTFKELEAFTRKNRELPRVGEARGMFNRSDALLEKLEEAYIYIMQLNDRLTALEKKKP